jgi:DNA topoisomerase-1
MRYIITEKDITARRIAHILSDGKFNRRRVGGAETYDFDGQSVIGLSGHVIRLDFPDSYHRWREEDLRKLLYAEIMKIPSQKKIFSALKKIAKDADHIIIATDFDREGELIGVEALEIIKDVNPDVKVDRVRYSAITQEEIKTAFAKPTEVDYDLASACEARQIIDLVWGATLTRFMSISAHRLGDEYLSVGRVQAPTLALLVDREKKIEAFVSKPYWEISTSLRNRDKFVAKHKNQRFLHKTDAQSIVSKIKPGTKGEITEIKKKRRETMPPIPFDTTGFIREACSIGFSATNAMRIAELLYTSGFISYPRTDNTVYPDLDFASLIKIFVDTEFDEYARALLGRELKPTAGKKRSTDHPPIHPVSLARKEDLEKDQWKIYELICRRFFSTFGDPSIIENTRVEIRIEEEPFIVTGSRMIERGWRWFYPYHDKKEQILPDLKKGMILIVDHVDLTEKETKPMPRYGQGELVKKMESLGLGTKSTRHEIIGKLYNRGYIQGKTIKPTRMGYAVTNSLEEYAEVISKPEMTALLEKDMNEIAEGKKMKENVVDESKTMLKEVLSNLSTNKREISKRLREEIGKDMVVGTCPECGSDLIVMRAKKRFIGCSGYPKCKFSLPLPNTGRLLITDKKCEEHGMYHIKVIGKNSFMLGCPYCNFIKWKEKKETNENKEKGD